MGYAVSISEERGKVVTISLDSNFRANYDRAFSLALDHMENIEKQYLTQRLKGVAERFKKFEDLRQATEF